VIDVALSPRASTLTFARNFREPMPTTEIVSIGARNGPFTVKKSVFAQRCDSSLISDRGLFQPMLDRLVGTIIHLGDFSDTPDDPCWFCGHCVEYREGDDDGHYIGYTPEAESELIELMSSMRDQSPTTHVLFLTDYQFGPETSEIVNYSIGGDIEGSMYWDYYDRAEE
jgi:hypothetical protein